MDVVGIVGYVLLGLSELLALLPVPTNGLLQSFFIGFQNSIKNSNPEVELAQSLLKKHPFLADIVKQIATNPAVVDNIKALLSNSQLNNFISKYQNDTDIQYISAILQEHPDKTQEVKRSIDTSIIISGSNS